VSAPLAVIDTNVLLALWIFADPEVATLRAALDAGRVTAVRSAVTDAEVAEVLARPGLFAVDADRRVALLQDWRARALLVDDHPPTGWRCRDPDDQKFVDLAVAARARWLITRDKALLKLNRKLKATGLAIVTPATFAGVSIADTKRSPASEGVRKPSEAGLFISR
jgi:uncharacterized protein